MKVLMLSIDPKLLDPKSAVSERIGGYCQLADEIHIIVYTPALGIGEQEKKLTKLSGNVFVYPTNNKSKLGYFRTAYRLASELIGRGEQFVITSQDGLTNLLAVLLSWRYKLGLEIQIHTDIFSPYFRAESLMNKLRLFGYWLGVKRAKSVRVVSKRIAKQLRESWSVPGSKIVVLPVFVDKERWQERGPGSDLHAKYPQFKQIILMASRLVREKDFPLALDVFGDLLPRFPKLGLVVVGEGPLKEQIVRDSVVLEPWAQDLSAYYRSADVFLLTSKYEGYGLSLVEAALSGLPIVTTDVGIVGDLITPHNALIAPVGDRVKLVAHLGFLLANDAARVMMKERLAKVVDHLPDKEVYMKLLKQSWQKCL